MKKFIKVLVGTTAMVAMAGTAQGQDMFIESGFDGEMMGTPVNLEGQIRSRTVSLNTDVVSDMFNRFAPAESMQLSLFPGRTITMQQTGFDPFMGERSKLWSGTIDGFENGFATLILQNGRLLGHIQYGGEVYRITPGMNGIHTISEVSVANLPDESEPFAVPAGALTASNAQKGGVTTSAFPTRIRVLVMFTPTAGSEAVTAGTTARDEGLLALGMANTALTNSKMGVYKYKWAGIRGVYCGYPAQTSTSTVLSDIAEVPAGNACASSRAATLRDTFSADMVAVLKGAGGCGTAYYLPSGGPESYAYSVTARACIFQHTFTHELGHNMGLQHDRFATGDLGISQSDYNFGLFHDNLGASSFRTIMSYSSGCSVTCGRVPVFTNTHAGGKWMGTTTGRGLHQTDPAVNRKKLKENWESVAAFR